jgi:glyoxylase-like metal-dependent hydrolase (beta-lactamase superfamily II)
MRIVIFMTFPLVGEGTRRRCVPAFVKTVGPYIASNQLQAFDGATQLFPGIRAVPAHGHPPGQTFYALKDNGEKLVFLGDTIHAPDVGRARTKLQRSSRQTYCPYKGDCAYYSIPAGGERSVNAAWTYEAPYAAVSAIREYLAFYPDRVDAIEVGVEG